MATAVEKRRYKIILMGVDDSGRKEVFEYLTNQVPDKKTIDKSCWSAPFCVCEETVQVTVSDSLAEVKSPKSYYFSADGAILVYDSMNLETLNLIPKNHIDNLRWSRGKIEPVCVLWGNVGSGNNKVEDIQLEGFLDRNREKIKLSERVDIERDSGHIIHCFKKLLEAIHVKHLEKKDLNSLTNSTVNLSECGESTNDKTESRLSRCC